LRGEERLPPPAATPRAPAAREATPTPPSAPAGDPTRARRPLGARAAQRWGGAISSAASRPALSGPDLRPIPRTPSPGKAAPAAPRPGTGIAYPMPGDDEDDDLPPPPGQKPTLTRPAPRATVGGPPPGIPPRAPGVHLSPRMTAIFGGLFGLATVTSVVALLIQVVPPRNERAIIAGSASASASASPSEQKAEARPKKVRVRTPIPGPWRLSELEKEPGVVIERGTMDKKSLFDALGEKGVPKSEIYRIIKALDGVRKFDKSKKKDRFAVAFEKASKKVRAFEYETTPSDIWQARAGDSGLLTGQKLDMKVAEEEYSGSFYVGSDLASSYKDAGFEDGILAALDEALAGHMSTEGFEEGGTVRVIATEETALGLFSRYKKIVAMEYRPPDPSAKPVRIYAFNGTEAHGYWDEKGRQPNAGGWRTPCPGAPVTSHFNPKRMHPVLHKPMPHTGTDFGAPSGAPIYAAYRGTIESIGPLGPCGNAVTISHPGGITTGYCHMSRFVSGLKPGDKVGTRQLVGYVGATGRATGPHLHFFAKKNNVFFDAMTLHMDGDRPVPAGDRAAFLAAKGELDRRLEAIPLPEPPPAPEKPAVAAAGSSSAEPDAPPAAGKEPSGDHGKEPKTNGKSTTSGGRKAAQVGSPEAIAAARAEPGIHPSQMTEVKGDEEDDGPPDTPSPAPSAKGKTPKGKPDPADDDDDDK
jgi:murein DD-endopeptidase MepM/ murein hydrolase activator NlpD